MNSLEHTNQLSEDELETDKNDFDQDLLGAEAVWTPEIQALGEKVSRWIKMDLPGAAVIGLQRCGKTWACSYLSETLANLVGYPLAIFMWLIPKNEIQRERAFYQDRLSDSGCNANAHRDVSILKNRLFNHIAECADHIGSKRVIIIVDDSQNLQNADVEILIHCFNRLEILKLRPFFLLVGQPELSETAVEWSKMKRMQAIGRFFTHIYQFRGVDLSDLDKVLESFNVVKRRDGTSTSMLNSVDIAISEGWVLKDINNYFVEAVNIALAAHNLSNIRLPMQYIRAAVLWLLNEFVSKQISPKKISTSHLLEALNESGLLSVLIYYSE